MIFPDFPSRILHQNAHQRIHGFDCSFGSVTTTVAHRFYVWGPFAFLQPAPTVCPLQSALPSVALDALDCEADLSMHFVPVVQGGEFFVPFGLFLFTLSRGAFPCSGQFPRFSSRSFPSIRAAPDLRLPPVPPHQYLSYNGLSFQLSDPIRRPSPKKFGVFSSLSAFLRLFSCGPSFPGSLFDI